MCDGNKDCTDGSDEFNCNKIEKKEDASCLTNEKTIKCVSSGKCVSRSEHTAAFSMLTFNNFLQQTLEMRWRA